MRIFDAIVLISIIAIILIGAVFSEGMFMNLSREGTEAINESSTVTQYGMTYAWIYVVAALLIVAVMIIALKLLRSQVPT